MALVIDERGVVVTCTTCGKRNRVPFGAGANCGQCHNPLPAPGEPLEVPTNESFDALIGRSRLPVVVDFWAPWCGPCLQVAPEIARVAASHAGRWIIAKVNTEALPVLAERFAIRSIPTMAVFARGREVTRTMGARPAAAIETFVSQALTGA